MTNVYFIRHSIPDLSIRDSSRPLTDEGIIKANELVSVFNDIDIDILFSSPYKRLIQTVEPIAKHRNLDINIIDDLREGKLTVDWVENFGEFCKKHWDNFSYKLENAESLSEVQFRNIQALNYILENYNGKNIIVGTHGLALAAIINYYDNTFQYDGFMGIINKMPYVISLNFDEKKYINRMEVTGDYNE